MNDPVLNKITKKENNTKKETKQKQKQVELLPDPILEKTLNNSNIEIEETDNSQDLVIKTMLSLNDIETKTDLNDALVLSLTKGAIHRDIFNCKPMELLVNYVYKHRISKGREGRKELKEMAKSLGGGFGMDEGSVSPFDRLVKGKT